MLYRFDRFNFTQLLVDDLAESIIGKEHFRFAQFEICGLLVVSRIVITVLPRRKLLGVGDQVAHVDDKVTLFFDQGFAVLVGDEAQLLKIVIIHLLIDGIVGHTIPITVSPEHLSLLKPFEIVLQDPVVQLEVLPVQVGVVEDARLEQVVAEVLTLLQVPVDIGQGGLE